MSDSVAAFTDPDVAGFTAVPANRADWADVQAVFGRTGYPARCRCQRLKVEGWMWRDSTLDERVAAQRTQTGCGDPAASTSGLLGCLHGEPVGWVAVEPRPAFPKLRGSPVPWRGRSEDRADPDVWAVTCFVVRTGFRGRGLMYPLARAAVGFARERGARALEGYPLRTEPGREITWGELHVGARQVFVEAGFTEVSRPTPRRVVMRVEFATPD